MKREISANLQDWSKKTNRRPLILEGARQVGKTYALTQFGQKYFNEVHIFNFEEDKSIHSAFEENLVPKRIIEDLTLIQQAPIDLKHDLVFFDEIQECPKALTSLKYFCENMPELALVSAGSLLGVKLSTESFPVGKVDYLQLHPMCFREFLLASEKIMLLEAYDNASLENKISAVAHKKLWDELLIYFLVGGMPKSIQTYVDRSSNNITTYDEIRVIQKNLIKDYNKDFAKHSGSENSVHIVSIFENIPKQMMAQIDGSTKRYRFKHVIPGKNRYAELQGPIDWLEQAGLIYKIKICNRPEIPLKAFCKYNLFKLFLFDIGLLGAMLDLPARSILNQDYGMTKGYLAEAFVAQELLAHGMDDLYSWTQRNSEIEFLIYKDGEVSPVEVKSGHRTRAKSLQQYLIKYAPKNAYKLSANPFSKSNTLTNLPLYLAGKL